MTTNLQFKLFLIFVTIVVSVAQERGKCSNSSSGNPLDCCPGYRIVGNICEECWPGTYGEDCRDPCPTNFFGRLCKEKCSCTPCDRVNGCTNMSISTIIAENGSSELSWSAILVSSFGSFVVSVTICLVFLCTLRNKQALRKLIQNCRKGYQNDGIVSNNPGNDHLKNSNEREKDKNGDYCYSETILNQAANQMDSLNTSDPQHVPNVYDQSDHEPYDVLKLSFRDEVGKVEYHLSPKTPSLKIESCVKYDIKCENLALKSNSNCTRQKIKNREERKHRREILRQMSSFKPKTSGNSHKKQLRYSFSKQSEII